MRTLGLFEGGGKSLEGPSRMSLAQDGLHHSSPSQPHWLHHGKRQASKIGAAGQAGIFL